MVLVAEGRVCRSSRNRTSCTVRGRVVAEKDQRSIVFAYLLLLLLVVSVVLASRR